MGEQRELYLLHEHPDEEAPYARLLGDALAGNGALFAREDSIEAAWAVVDPVLVTHPRAVPYECGSWGPKEADALIAADGSWHNPKSVKEKKCKPPNNCTISAGCMSAVTTVPARCCRSICARPRICRITGQESRDRAEER